MAKIKENPNYRVSNLVLSRNEPFTIWDIEVELKKEGSELQIDIIKSVLDKLNDNGVVAKNRGQYMLSIFDY